MLIDARSLDAETALDADVCVIGGGAAGITLARELSQAHVGVVVLESGGAAYDEDTQSLYDGPVAGGVLRVEDNYLKASRLRFLGGTTNHWDGWCRPLDPLDFERRDWVPMSGWPVSLKTLEPFYRRACDHVQIREFDYDPATLQDSDDPYLFPPESAIETRIFHLSPPTRFGDTYRKELIDSPDVRVFTWANVLELETGEAGTELTAVRAATLTGRKLRVRARVFVLAAGAVENARLLLVSNRVHKSGLGNQNDMVGRCFMEHPSFQPIGFVVLPRRREGLGLYDVARRPDFPNRIQALLFLSPEVQRERQLLNTCFSPHISKVPPLSSEVNELAIAIERLGPLREALSRTDTYYGKLGIISEQAPNPDSRVTLSEERDALGLPRARLDWRLGKLEQRSMRRSIELFASELGRHGLGRGSYFLDDRQPWHGSVTSSHHMGTTRMSAAPGGGVVDPDLRVHGLGNLYVASSSVFPTCGVSNPTLTIVALTVRLANHLKSRMGDR